MTVSKGKSTTLDLGTPESKARVLLAYPGGLFFTKRYKDPKTGAEGAARFQGTFLFPENDPVSMAEFMKVYNAAIEIAEVNYNDGETKVVTRDGDGKVIGLMKKPMFSWCFQRGSEFADEERAKQRDAEAFRGYWIVRAGMGAERGGLTQVPSLAVLNGGVLTDVPEDGTRSQYTKFFYPGVEVLIALGISPIRQGKAGVTAYLNAVCSFNRGDALTGAGNVVQDNSSASSRFSKHVGQLQTGASPYGSGANLPVA